MKALLAYWYHFIVMFEAVFILTTVDAGTRVARFLAQETLGRFDARFLKHDWKPGIYSRRGWSSSPGARFLRTGSISTLWPMLGIANQLLATTALCVGTTVIVNAGRARYALVTLVPLAFVATTTLTAAYLSTVNNFLKLGNFQGWLDAVRLGGADVLHRRRPRRVGAALDPSLRARGRPLPLRASGGAQLAVLHHLLEPRQQHVDRLHVELRDLLPRLLIGVF